MEENTGILKCQALLVLGISCNLQHHSWNEYPKIPRLYIFKDQKE